MTSSDEIRIGIIGAGYISTWHADAIRATPGIRLAAVCDTSSSAAQGFAAGHGITAFTAVEDLIAEARSCCTQHTLTPAERELFGLPPIP